MAQNDISERSWPGRVYDDVLSAFSLLTRIPLPAHNFTGARSAWAWPLVGAFIGAAMLAAITLTQVAGIPVFYAAPLVVLVQIMLTGAMHEDGLADCADGFWGGFDPARRLEIMKDSAIGTYGVIALVLSLLLRVLLLGDVITEVSESWLLVIVLVPVLSRVPMIFVMALLPNARKSGLSDATGRPGFAPVLCALLITFIPSFWLLEELAVLIIFLLAVSTIVAGLLMKRKIGGQTGDTLGATQQISEIVILLALVSALTK